MRLYLDEAAVPRTVGVESLADVDVPRKWSTFKYSTVTGRVRIHEEIFGSGPGPATMFFWKKNWTWAKRWSVQVGTVWWRCRCCTLITLAHLPHGTYLLFVPVFLTIFQTKHGQNPGLISVHQKFLPHEMVNGLWKGSAATINNPFFTILPTALTETWKVRLLPLVKGRLVQLLQQTNIDLCVSRPGWDLLLAPGVPDEAGPGRWLLRRRVRRLLHIWDALQLRDGGERDILLVAGQLGLRLQHHDPAHVPGHLPGGHRSQSVHPGIGVCGFLQLEKGKISF